MENIDLVYSFFNQYMFADVKNNIDQIQYYFETNPSSGSNRLISELLSAIRTYQFESLDYPLFQSILVKCGKNPAESGMILSEIEKWKRYTKDQIAPCKGFLQGLICSNVIKSASFKYKDDPVGYLRYLKQVDVKTGSWESSIAAKSFSSFDINSIKDEILSGGYRSAFPWLNNSYEPTHLVPAGQVIVVSACPGTGKTLFCCNEALCMALQGHKTHFLAMGDTKDSDFIGRIATIYSGLPFGEAYQNIDNIYRQLQLQIKDNLCVSIHPANVIKIDEYIDFILDNQFKVCFIDYDSNFNIDDLGTGDGGMYKYFGNLYGSLSKLTQAGVLVYICAQPKTGTYENEYFNEGMLGESRRKQEHADVVIGITRKMNCPNQIGNICITKNRRGKMGIYPYIRLGNGRFKVIPQAVYQAISQIPDERRFTEGEIDSLINQDMINQQRIANQNGPLPQSRDKVNSPFK